MSLKESAVYLSPDGRRLLANSTPRPFTSEPAWTLTPADPSNTLTPFGRMLFVEADKVFEFSFDSLSAVQDTGWTINNLLMIDPIDSATAVSVPT